MKTVYERVFGDATPMVSDFRKENVKTGEAVITTRKNDHKLYSKAS